jgi:hypothetical protein
MTIEFCGWEVGDRVIVDAGPWEGATATVTGIDRMTGLIWFTPDDPEWSTGECAVRAWQLVTEA